ncbi:MAG: CDGSH iron-sulfur domain-containing protein [Planctomycetes bacterium]|nr:CDGSH iron-sulfur domain-containing protein [Planctomycetota bacterium]
MARLVKLNATGPVKVEPSDKPIFVCACGLSKKFPFCDGTHKTCRDEAEGQTLVYDENGQRREAPRA